MYAILPFFSFTLTFSESFCTQSVPLQVLFICLGILSHIGAYHNNYVGPTGKTTFIWQRIKFEEKIHTNNMGNFTGLKVSLITLTNRAYSVNTLTASCFWG